LYEKVTRKGLPLSEINYTYDELNRLVETVYPDGRRVRYTYDPAGNCIETRLFKAGEEAPAAVPVKGPGLPAIPAPAPQPPFMPAASPPPRKKIPRLALALGAASLLFLCLCLALSAGVATNLF
jgi:YD repeat-containing protein